MNWTENDTDTGRIASPSGDIDHTSADAFKQKLLPALSDVPNNRFVLDLSAVAYMSSVGLRVIMLAVKQAKADGVKLAVCGLNETLAEIFQITRFDKIIAIHPDADAALTAE